MPIISPNDTKSFRGRLVVALIYGTLILGGLTMVFPFAITLTGAVSTDLDYMRRSPLPRFLWSRADRFMRVLSGYFPAGQRHAMKQLRGYFPTFPEAWTAWAQIGQDTDASDAWAREQLARLDDPARRAALETMARDYGDFLATLAPRETVLAFDPRYVAPFLRRTYGSVENLNAAWEMAADDFSQVKADVWSGEPIDQRGYVPPTDDARHEDGLAFRRAYLEHDYTRFLKGDWDQANYLRPASLAYAWEEYAGRVMGMHDPGQQRRLPFPVPADGTPELARAWDGFLRERLPMRHVRITVTDALQVAYRQFLEHRFHKVEYYNSLVPEGCRIFSWSDVTLADAIPPGLPGRIWLDFVDNAVPREEWDILSSLPEKAFQQFALGRHGSLEGIARAYGLELDRIEQLRIPFGETLLVSFDHHEWRYTWNQATAGFRTVGDFLFRRGVAVRNTIILVALSILVSLTVNPLAGYALSRFRLPQTEKVVVFCLATSAFPGAVASIPGFLLLRDLGLLNTFAALVLPGAASGMSIFLLKGFFDSLPQELYDAATIDGAPEWRIFLNISLPLVKPILAVGALGSFLAAYNGWEWAIVVCQNPRLWTVAVWTYQFQSIYNNSQPYTVMAAFIVNSIPVFLVFLFCQKIILRGIILPTMK